MKRVLEGLRVLDFTRVLSGPYCSMILADMGADVVKIEAPKVGDDTRFFGPFKNKESLYFANFNRSKKSITLDLKNPKALEIVTDLIQKSDILVENFKPGVMEGLGLGYEDVKKIKPDIIYGSISGYGHTGPMRANAAYDVIIQGLSGLMSLTGFSDKPPVRVGTSITDIVSGMNCALGILGALNHKSVTGEGMHVDIAMLDSGISILENAVFRYTINGEIPKRIGTRHTVGAPHNTYQTKDGYVVIACGNDSLWKRMSKLMGKEEYADHPDFNSMAKRAQNVDAIDQMVEEWTKTMTCVEVVELLNSGGIPVGKVNTIPDLLEDPQLLARKMFTEVEHPVLGPVLLTDSPIKYNNAVCGIAGPPPRLGQHNKEVICDFLGYPEDILKEIG